MILLMTNLYINIFTVFLCGTKIDLIIYIGLNDLLVLRGTKVNLIKYVGLSDLYFTKTIRLKKSYF